MEIFGDVGDRTVRIGPAVAKERKAAACIDDLFAVELRQYDFLICVAGFGDDFSQRINHQALAGHLPVALAAHVIAGGQE